MKISVLALFCLWSLTTFSQVPDYVPTDGLVGWWPFNGNANDESGNGNDGVVNGATLTQDRNGEANKAYSFDGMDDKIDVPSSENLNMGMADFSISLYFNSLAIPIQDQQYPYLYIIQKRYYSLGDGYSLYVDASNNVHAEILDSNSTTDIGTNQEDLALGQWYHFVVVFHRQGNAQLFINGVLQNSLPINSENGNLINDKSLGIGYFSPPGPNCLSGCHFYNGKLDDIGIWNRALTECEIESLYLAQANSLGCTQPEACNYNPEAFCDDGSCVVAPEGFDCLGNCITDYNQNGIADAEEIWGCTYPSASNYNPNATDDDGSCNFSCPGDLNNDEIINTSDLLLFLSYFGQTCQ